MYFEYRIVKIEKGLFLIEYKTAFSPSSMMASEQRNATPISEKSR